MRPRPDAAENARRTAASSRGTPRFNEAAARCRGKRFHAAGAFVPSSGFNEAAARCRGKLNACSVPKVQAGASMRPRPDAAENPGRRAAEEQIAHSFNEAAARCRGKLDGGAKLGGQHARFNEAAARCRGKPGGRRWQPQWSPWLQ